MTDMPEYDLHTPGLCLDDIRRRYAGYIDRYRDDSGTLPAMMELKRVHTEKVVEAARAIATGEGFSPPELERALVAALLHDAGRFEQLRRFGTFNDAKSVDHAVFSHDIVREAGWTRDADVLAAILYHNRRDLPEGMDPVREKLCHLVRDADKLDIFRVLEDQLARNPDLSQDAFWGLQPGEPSEAVVSAILNRRPVDYGLVRTLADFILIQVGWLRNDLHFATARRLAAERGHLEFRRRLLRRFTTSPLLDPLFRS